MEKEYGKIASYHYSMYRPPLHEMILAKCLKSDKVYDLGLDIGCGTGRSSIALSNYSKKVIGIDPSMEMLQKSIAHPKVDYQLFNRKDLLFEDQSIDIITFAGSLYYAKSQRLVDEVIRVSKKESQIIVYDFKIDLRPILQYLSTESWDEFEEAYNYEEDFSGLNAKGINKKTSSKEDLLIDISTANITHLLLSSKETYEMLVNKFGAQNLEKDIHSNLMNSNNQFEHKINSSIYYTIYEV